MRLDRELVRYTLLSIESNSKISGPDEKELLKAIAKYSQYDRNEVAYVIAKLKEGNYITGEVQWANNKPVWITPGNLTFKGHEFLDNIRNDGVWNKTKEKLSKYSSVPLTIISNVAASVLTQLIDQQMGK